MKIVAFSDLHGNISKLDNWLDGADIAIVAGDFASLKGRGKWHFYDQKKWVQSKFIPILENHASTQTVIVPGNHDFCMDQPRMMQLLLGKDMNIQWPSNCHVLFDSSCEIFGLKFYGTPWVPIISYSWAFEAEHDFLSSKFQAIPEDLDFLVSHAPPRIPHAMVDVSLQTYNGPFGSTELAEAIFQKAPKNVICGHIHTGDHDGLNFNGSMIWNVSVLNEDYELAYEPKVFEL